MLLYIAAGVAVVGALLLVARLVGDGARRADKRRHAAGEAKRRPSKLRWGRLLAVAAVGGGALWLAATGKLVAALSSLPALYAFFINWASLARRWGRKSESRQSHSFHSGAHRGAMSRKEALQILGLEEGADAEAVSCAYRKLMARLHPDHGGSQWLAARLNEARARLLRG